MERKSERERGKFSISLECSDENRQEKKTRSPSPVGQLRRLISSVEDLI